MKTDIAYIYGLYSSGNLEVIRYIGYSIDPLYRLGKHISESKSLRYRRHKWIQYEIKKGNSIGMEILRCGPANIIGVYETETILLYKSFGADLTNSNLGGIGGKSPTQEVREKLRVSKLGNTWNKGRRPSEENLRLIREAAKRPKSKETIKKRTDKTRGRRINRKLSDDLVRKILDLQKIYRSPTKVATELEIKLSTVSNVIYSNFYQDIKNQIK